ncbi:MAG: group II truncated hemoglobin [Rhodoferax sp.]|uniref:group II truncated hemoglobin n=1 Tax=Rhodoferax sp. TaxID=50421 RepID=UPI0030193B02
MTNPIPITPYDELGGEAGIRCLVHRFYELMDELPEAYTVRRMHPESLTGSEEMLFEFLSGWFGGPALYIAKKGHPRLRMRHAPYAVGPVERDEWMLCMRQALSEQVSDAAFLAHLIETFSQMANHMVNTDSTKEYT